MLELINNKKEKTELNILHEAFATFNEASESLKSYYEKLEERIKELNLQLEEKNRALAESQNYLSSILQSLNTGVIVTDLEGKITIFNKGAGIITGLPLEGIRGRHIREIFRYDDSGCHRDVKDIPVSYVEIPYKRINGDTIHISLSVSAVRGPDNREAGIVYLLNDITETKRLKEESERTSRLKAMGEMAAQIAHDLRNPLGSIEIFSSLLRKELSDDKDNKGLTEHISSSVKSMDRIISNLLYYTKPPRLIFKKVNLNKIIEDSLIYPLYLIQQNNIEIIKRSVSPEIEIYCDEELMKQVFLNLILNAVQSMSESKSKRDRLVIESDYRYTGLSLFDNRDKKKELEVKISDTGTGIDKEDIKKIFDPFFTTKERGTGLGLAIVHNIIQAHNGRIEVESSEDKGSTFTIILPTLTSSEEIVSSPLVGEG
ncbi:MAG: nitrogen regulation protein NR(II) [Nitrospirota bacterium]